MLKYIIPLLLLATPTYADNATVAFSPHGGATELVIQTINEARASVRLAGYGFTSYPIANALDAACIRGVSVRLVLDKSQINSRAARGLKCALVRYDSEYRIMHSKYLVIDGITLETGSFNYTKSAENNNAENVLVLRNSPVIRQYIANFDKLWGESR